MAGAKNEKRDHCGKQGGDPGKASLYRRWFRADGVGSFEKSAEVNGAHGLRNTIEHIENIHPDDLDRFAELDVIPSVQPYHVTLAANGKVNQIGKNGQGFSGRFGLCWSMKVRWHLEPIIRL